MRTQTAIIIQTTPLLLNATLTTLLPILQLINLVLYIHQRPRLLANVGAEVFVATPVVLGKN